MGALIGEIAGYVIAIAGAAVLAGAARWWAVSRKQNQTRDQLRIAADPLSPDDARDELRDRERPS